MYVHTYVYDDASVPTRSPSWLTPPCIIRSSLHIHPTLGHCWNDMLFIHQRPRPPVRISSSGPCLSLSLSHAKISDQQLLSAFWKSLMTNFSTAHKSRLSSCSTSPSPLPRGTPSRQQQTAHVERSLSRFLPHPFPLERGSIRHIQEREIESQ